MKPIRSTLLRAGGFVRFFAGLVVGVFFISVGQAQPTVPQFKTPQAAAAKTRYDRALTTIKQDYSRELDAARNRVMRLGNLDEANAISAALKQLQAGTVVGAEFKSAPAVAAKTKYTQAVTLAKRQYSRELEAALKTAMSAANLDEANAINRLRSQLETELSAVDDSAGGAGSGAASPSGSGLLVKEYPRLKVQSNEGVPVPLADLGAAIGNPYVIKTPFSWKPSDDRNAVASGFLKVEQDGDYEFRTKSFYDRNSLMVNGTEVCQFADGEEKVATIALKKGMIPFVAVGYVGGRSLDVTWRPPGQAEFGEIPARLLSH